MRRPFLCAIADHNNTYILPTYLLFNLIFHKISVIIPSLGQEEGGRSAYRGVGQRAGREGPVTRTPGETSHPTVGADRGQPGEGPYRIRLLVTGCEV